MKRGGIVDEKYCFEMQVNLTVHKTSMFFPGDCFVAYDPDGELLFRFDSYGPDSQSKDELVLMDATGKCLLTLLRKEIHGDIWDGEREWEDSNTTPKPRLHQRWEGLVGEKTENKNPAFSVRRSSIIGQSSVVVDVYGDPGDEHQIQGSYPQRCCTIFNTSSDSSTTSKEPVAEIRRKVDPTTNVILGKDVFLLCLSPGFDGACS